MKQLFFLVVIVVLLASCARQSERVVIHEVPAAEEIDSSSKTTLIFNAHPFSCDSLYTTVEVNICSGEKFDFADSLMNALYNHIFNSLDSEITVDARMLAACRSKVYNDSLAKKEDIRFYTHELDYDQRFKAALFNSQQSWLKQRNTNAHLFDISCEGGSGCPAIMNNYALEATLQRIKILDDMDYK